MLVNWSAITLCRDGHKLCFKALLLHPKKIYWPIWPNPALDNIVGKFIWSGQINLTGADKYLSYTVNIYLLEPNMKIFDRRRQIFNRKNQYLTGGDKYLTAAVNIWLRWTIDLSAPVK
jgi:hypothetical protein